MLESAVRTPSLPYPALISSGALLAALSVGAGISAAGASALLAPSAMGVLALLGLSSAVIALRFFRKATDRRMVALAALLAAGNGLVLRWAFSILLVALSA